MFERIAHLVLVAAAALGLLFSSVSTSDFTAHLDRQVHGLHCSFLPGVDTPDVSGASGCHATLMSPYSSFARDAVWGGIPVSLPSMAVFAYLLVLALGLLALGKTSDPRASGYQALAWALPFGTSLVFGYLSLHELDAACKLCIGIYGASTLGLAVAVVVAGRARRGRPRAPRGLAIAEGTLADRTQLDDAPPASTALAETQLERDERALDTIPDDGLPRSLDPPPRSTPRLATASELDRRIRGGTMREGGRSRPAAPGTSLLALGLAFALGVLFVALPVFAYALAAPDFDRFVGACGTLPHPSDDARVLVTLGDTGQATSLLEVLDPLCASCRGFERRFSAHEASRRVSRRALLMPLDTECNWMLDTSLHPGACAISEAILCAEGDADEVLAWSFDHQEEISEAERASPGAARRLVSERFPALSRCIGGAPVRARLNRALRFAVQNQLPVLTPQLYVNDTRICDEDTDLGLDYVLTRLIARAPGGAR